MNKQFIDGVLEVLREDGQVVSSNDDFEDCIEVICFECKATSEDEDIERGIDEQ